MADDPSSSDTKNLLNISHDTSGTEESDRTNHDKSDGKDVSMTTGGNDSEKSAAENAKDISIAVENSDQNVNDTYVSDSHIHVEDTADNAENGVDDEHAALIGKEEAGNRGVDEADSIFPIDDMTKR